MTDHGSVVDLLQDAAADALAAPDAALDILLGHAFDCAGASSALLLVAGAGQARPLAACGLALPDELVQAVLDVEEERASASDTPSTSWTRCCGSADDMHRVTHRSASHGPRRLVMILAFSGAAEETAAARALCDWLLLSAVIWTSRSHPLVGRREQEREAAHRINNALGAIAMHSDLGTLLTDRPESDRLHRLFHEIAQQAAVCATAVRTFLRRG